MWLGPVFQTELMTLARRGRHYLGRTLYGGIVLIVIFTVYHEMTQSYGNPGEIPTERLSRFGQAIFAAFATLQAAIALAMTPAIVAGAIADEKQRKTLHYLMASQLSSTEIVVGKVAARLLRMAILGAIGLPVLSLIALFGGVDYELIGLIYAATASMTFLLASISILCSVYAPRPRDAIARAYVCEFFWLILPVLLSTRNTWTPFWWRVGEWCLPTLDWVAASSPTSLLVNIGMLFAPGSLIDKAVGMIILQTAGGLTLIALAALRLRPVFRGASGRRSRWRSGVRPRDRGRKRLWARPEVGDDAMLWKEMHLFRISDIRRVFYITLGMALVGLCGYLGWDLITAAIGEIRQEGFGSYGRSRREINSLLKGANALAIVALLTGVGLTAASSLTSEREGDTWTTLAASPIEGVEMVRSKIIGALWLYRPLGLFLVGCWGFGILIGAVHPLGALICLIELVVFSSFAASLGVAISLRARNTIGALAATIGTLLLMNVGYLIVLAIFEIQSMTILFGCIPFLFTVGLVGIDEPARIFVGTSSQVCVASLLGMLFYASATVGLTLNAIANYDRVVGRPNRARPELTAAKLNQILGSADSSPRLKPDDPPGLV